MPKLLTQKDIGERIRLARERVPYSQKELADLIDKDQKAIYAYEIGERKISAVDLARIAHVLNVAIGYFYYETAEADELDQIMLREFHALSNPHDKRDAISFLNILVNFAKRKDS